jgi:ketosteroid isomerase-like protein
MTGGEEHRKALVGRAFDDWARGAGSVFDLLAEDATWTITGSCPISATYNSKQEFLDGAIAPLYARLAEPFVPSVRGMYAEGETVVVLFDARAVAKDGKPYQNTYSWYLTFEGDAVKTVVAFFDGIKLAELWERVPAQ